MTQIAWRRLFSPSFSTNFFLLILAGLSQGLYLPWYGLIGDDWWFFTRLSDGTFFSTQFIANPNRPIAVYLWVSLWSFLRFKLWAYYLFSIAVQWASACYIANILIRFFDWAQFRAVVVAAFFLLYPADTARLYLAALSARVATLVALIGADLWLSANKAATASRWRTLAGLTLVGVAPLTYETPLFLLAVVPISLWQLLRLDFWVWLRKSIAFYSVLIGCLAFRLWVVYEVSNRPTPFYVSVNISINWLQSQLWAILEAITWKGWLYSVKAMLDVGLIPSLVLLLTAMAIMLPLLTHWQNQDGNTYGNVRRNIVLIIFGLGLAITGAIPPAVSSAPLANAVGTLEARLIHATALGHALMLTGIWSLIASVISNRPRTQRLIWSGGVATMLALALIANLGVQRSYARAWQSQLNILNGLQSYANQFRDHTAILLLEMPTEPFDLRFYYPFTQLVRHYYASTTLHALPWSAGFQPEKQLLAFDQTGIVVRTDTSRADIQKFDYNDVAGFRLNATGNLESVDLIEDKYFTNPMAPNAYIPMTLGSFPKPQPIQLFPVQTFALEQQPSPTAWRDWLLAQLAFSKLVPIP